MDEILTRIIDRDRVPEVNGEDYLLIDSEEEGLRKIKAVNLLNKEAAPPPPVYNWYYNPSKTLSVREEIATGKYKIWFWNFVVDTIVSGQYRQPIPSEVVSFLSQRVNVSTDYRWHNLNGSAISGNIVIQLLNEIYYVQGSVSGSSYKLSGTIEKAIMTSEMVSGYNRVDLNTEWSEPTFDPYNG